MLSRRLAVIFLAGALLPFVAIRLDAMDSGVSRNAGEPGTGAPQVASIPEVEADSASAAGHGSADLPGLCSEPEPSESELSILAPGLPAPEDKTHAWTCPLIGNNCSLTSQCNHTYPECACCICLRGGCYCYTWACH